MDARTRSEAGSVDARTSLATWLRAGRDRRNLTIEDVAKITKIQPRILEKLERGELDGLPAEVFVKGFVRSFAKCVGLDEALALEKYGAAQAAPPSAAPIAPMTTAATITAKALVDTMVGAPAVEPVTPAPVVEAAPVVEVAPIIEAAPVVEAAAAVEAPAAPSKKKNRGKKRGNRKNKKTSPPAIETASAVETPAVEESIVEQQVIASLETGPVAKIDAESIDTASIEAKTTEPIPTVVEDGAVESASLAEGSQRISSGAIEVVDATELSADVEPAQDTAADTAGTWQPTMPPIATSPSVPWRRPHLPAASRASSKNIQPSLLIDDADPDSADREREDRIAKEPHRLSFLPPILLDREDRSARQGGLTLAVILLLIAATLTLSYLMRRPSTSADGVTQLDTHGEPASLA